MIYDVLDSDCVDWIASRQLPLKEAFAWLRAMPINVPDGNFQLADCGASVNVHGYDTKAPEDCRWESHRRTVDLQCCITGSEIIEWVPVGSLRPLNDYVETKDTEHWAAAQISTTRLRMTPRTFVLFLPNELHRPKVRDDESIAVRKLVIKFDAELLGV